MIEYQSKSDFFKVMTSMAIGFELDNENLEERYKA